MIGEQDAPDGQPGHKLGQDGDEDKQPPAAFAAHRLDGHGEKGRQPGPGHQGVIEGGEKALHSRHVQVAVIQNGPPVENPLIPVGRVGVGGVDALVVGEHEVLVFQHGVHRVGAVAGDGPEKAVDPLQQAGGLGGLGRLG